MQLGSHGVGFVRHGAVLVVVAALACFWERLAMQMPSSPYHVGVLAEPVGDLKWGALLLGLSFVAVALLGTWIRPGRVIAGSLHVGAAITVVALAYGATTGMKGVQFSDPRGDSLALLATRLVGEVILGIGLVGCVWRIWRARPPETTP